MSGTPTQWYGVVAMRDGKVQHWHRIHGGTGEELRTTRAEAERTCKALNEFSAERTDSLGWSYEVRPYGGVS
jgi:hypothetical protein